MSSGGECDPMVCARTRVLIDFSLRAKLLRWFDLTSAGLEAVYALDWTPSEEEPPEKQTVSKTERKQAEKKEKKEKKKAARFQKRN